MFFSDFPQPTQDPKSPERKRTPVKLYLACGAALGFLLFLYLSLPPSPQILEEKIPSQRILRP